MKQFTWQLMCKNIKKTLKINFLYLTRTLPRTSDRLHMFFTHVFASLGCYPRLSAAPRSIPAHQPPWCAGLLRKAADNSLVMRRVAENMSKKHM